MTSFVKHLAESLLGTIGAIVIVSTFAVAIAVWAFELSVSGSVALYFVIWWVLLFAVLPFGVRSQAESGEVIQGSEPGAPALPALREKAIWTTLVSSVVLVLAAAVFPLAGL